MNKPNTPFYQLNIYRKYDFLVYFWNRVIMLTIIFYLFIFLHIFFQQETYVAHILGTNFQVRTSLMHFSNATDSECFHKNNYSKVILLMRTDQCVSLYACGLKAFVQIPQTTERYFHNQ